MTPPITDATLKEIEEALRGTHADPSVTGHLYKNAAFIRLAKEHWPSLLARVREAELDCVEWENEVIGLQADTENQGKIIGELQTALEPFANYACDKPCDCHNCKARAALARSKGGGK